LTALAVIRTATSFIDAQIIAVYVVITSTALSRVHASSTQFVSTILVTTTTLKVETCPILLNVHVYRNSYSHQAFGNLLRRL